MPKAKTGNFTLRTIAKGLTDVKAFHRFLALQRSGNYSELRIIQTGSRYAIKGYRWPDKTTRRKLGIGKNPSPKNAVTPNQVYFGQGGKTKLGWINRETPTRYLITYKSGPHTKQAWRKKDKVKFVGTGKTGKVRNKCPKMENPKKQTQAAIEMSEKFHGYKPRHIRNTRLTWPTSLVRIGACAQIDYVSDKYDGKLRRYYHEFETPCEVYAGPVTQADGTNLLIIRGKFKIKPDGIIG